MERCEHVGGQGIERPPEAIKASQARLAKEEHLARAGRSFGRIHEAVHRGITDTENP